MLSSQANETQPATSSSSYSPPPVSLQITERIDVPVREHEAISAEQAREIVRLWQCRLCSLLLVEPVTLPCGKSLCQRCLPETYVRTNISYPPLASRLRGFCCPFPDCGKEHVLGDCGVDVTLKKTLAVVKAEFEKDRRAAGLAGLSTHVLVRDVWGTTGVPSLKEPDGISKMVVGGRLLATYILADDGSLEYSAEVTYECVPEDRRSDSSDPDGDLLGRVKAVVRSEMDCQVCYALYCEPFTTPCGHTFCRACLHRVLDHSSYCPICRRALSNGPTLHGQARPSNDFLLRVTTTFWADDLALRKQAVQAEGNLLNNAEFDIPVFVCTLSFPQMPTFLHVFEPRYRLMVRRALEGDRMFGMVAYQRPRGPDGVSFAELGTMLRITNVEFYQDGRSLLETVGVSRFRVVRHGVLDGYLVAKIDRINDISVADEEELEAAETRSRHGVRAFMTEVEGAGGVGTAASMSELVGGAAGNGAVVGAGDIRGRAAGPSTLADLETMSTRELMDFALAFVRRMQEQSVGWLTARILAIYGECPDDPAVFPWWFASILPVRDMQKYRLLSTTSVRERLKICCGWAMEWQSSRW